MKDPCSLFGSDINICVAQSQRMFESQGLIRDVQKNIALGKNPSKARPWMVSVICFILEIASGSGGR